MPRVALQALLNGQTAARRHVAEGRTMARAAKRTWNYKHKDDEIEIRTHGAPSQTVTVSAVSESYPETIDRQCAKGGMSRATLNHYLTGN